MLTTLLTRYGLSATSVLSINKRDLQTYAGNSDATILRTLEILGNWDSKTRYSRMDCLIENGANGTEVPKPLES